jgi:hypothetical protein
MGIFNQDFWTNPAMAGSLGMMAAGGPSRMPVSLGQGLLSGLSQGSQAYRQNLQAEQQKQQAELRRVQMQQIQAQLEQANTEAQRQREFAKLVAANPGMTREQYARAALGANQLNAGDAMTGIYGAETKPSATYSNFLKAKADGFPGNFMEYQLALKNASKTDVNVYNNREKPPEGFRWVNPAKGPESGVVPITGGPKDPEQINKTEASQIRDKVIGYESSRGPISGLKSLVEQHGTEMVNQEVVGAMKTQYRLVLATLADMSNAGVLQPGELPMFQAAIPDPSTWNNQWPWSAKRILSSLNTLEKEIDTRMALWKERGMTPATGEPRGMPGVDAGVGAAPQGARTSARQPSARNTPPQRLRYNPQTEQMEPVR